MIGRAAIGNPWIFPQIVASLQGKVVRPTGLDQRFDWMRNYLKTSIKYIGELHACRMMRSRLGWFVKGLPHNGKFRESIKQIRSESEALERIDDYQDFLRERL